MRRLVVAEVIVAPAGHLRHPLPLVGGEIGHLQLVLTAGMIGRMLVHRRHDRVAASSGPSVRLSTYPTRIRCLQRPIVSPGSRNRLGAEIDRQVPQPAIGRYQVFQMRGARTWQADDDDRSVDDLLRQPGDALSRIGLVLEPVRRRLDAAAPRKLALACRHRLPIRADFARSSAPSRSVKSMGPKSRRVPVCALAHRQARPRPSEIDSGSLSAAFKLTPGARAGI